MFKPLPINLSLKFQAPFAITAVDFVESLSNVIKYLHDTLISVFLFKEQQILLEGQN